MTKQVPQSGFLLIEVLIAIALFGLCSVYIVQAAFTANRFQSVLVDELALEADLRAACSLIAKKSKNVEEFEEGGEVEGLAIGEVEWMPEIESTNIPHLYRVTLELSYEGNRDLGLESGERTLTAYYFRSKWAQQSAEWKTEASRAAENLESEMIDLADRYDRNYRAWRAP